MPRCVTQAATECPAMTFAVANARSAILYAQTSRQPLFHQSHVKAKTTGVPKITFTVKPVN